MPNPRNAERVSMLSRWLPQVYFPWAGPAKAWYPALSNLRRQVSPDRKTPTLSKKCNRTLPARLYSLERALGLVRTQPMSDACWHALVRHVRLCAGLPADGATGDAQLLDAFVHGRDAAAFGLLLRRHG